MKKFEFRLQTLLSIREAAEKKIQNELAELLNVQNAMRAKQQDYNSKIKNEREYLNKKMKDGNYSYNDVLTFEKFYEGAIRAINILEQEIQGMEESVNEVRNRLIEASRERKVVEKLKEKKWKEYLYELNREENKENDDANQKIYNMHKNAQASMV